MKRGVYNSKLLDTKSDCETAYWGHQVRARKQGIVNVSQGRGFSQKRQDVHEGKQANDMSAPRIAREIN